MLHSHLCRNHILQSGLHTYNISSLEDIENIHTNWDRKRTLQNSCIKEKTLITKSKGFTLSLITTNNSWISKRQAILFPRVQVHVLSPSCLMPMVLISVASDSFPCVYSYPDWLSLPFFLHMSIAQLFLHFCRLIMTQRNKKSFLLIPFSYLVIMPLIQHYT